LQRLDPPLVLPDDAAMPLAKCLRPAVSAARDEIRVNEALIAHDPEKWEPVFG